MVKFVIEFIKKYHLFAFGVGAFLIWNLNGISGFFGLDLTQNLKILIIIIIVVFSIIFQIVMTSLGRLLVKIEELFFLINKTNAMFEINAFCDKNKNKEVIDNKDTIAVFEKLDKKRKEFEINSVYEMCFEEMKHKFKYK